MPVQFWDLTLYILAAFILYEYWRGVKAMKPVLTYYELFVIVYNIVSSTLEIRKIEDRMMKSPTKIQ